MQDYGMRWYLPNIGHAGGVQHPHAPTKASATDPDVIKFGQGRIPNNLMAQNSKGYGLTANQLKVISETIKKNNPMLKERISTNSGNTGIIQDKLVPNPRAKINYSDEEYVPIKNKEKAD